MWHRQYVGAAQLFFVSGDASTIRVKIGGSCSAGSDPHSARKPKVTLRKMIDRIAA
jgi:hypothetical protein